MKSKWRQYLFLAPLRIPKRPSVIFTPIENLSMKAQNVVTALFIFLKICNLLKFTVELQT